MKNVTRNNRLGFPDDYYLESSKIYNPEPPNFDNIEVGDQVYVDGRPGLSMAGMYADWQTVEKVEPTRFLAGGQWFGKDGYPQKPPYAYYCSSLKKCN
jgi:hypothetical protein